jgi:hypothetical protein
MSPNERLEILKKAPPNSWLAFDENESRLVGVAPTYTEAVALAAKEGVEEPVLVKTPEDWLTPVF